MTPTVSVVIPVYNVEPYLRDCLDSVLSQTFHNLEIICVDDGSTDGSPAILDEFARRDTRIRIIRQTNGGLSAARNAGMDAATGTYLYFLDSDDLVVPDAVSRLFSLAEEAYLDQIIFSATPAAEPGTIPQEFVDRLTRYYTVPDDCSGKTEEGPVLFERLLVQGHFFVSVPLRFFRRSAIPRYLRFPEGILHEDNYFSPLSLLAAKRAMAIPQRLYVRRIRPHSITTEPGREKRRADSLKSIYGLLEKEKASPTLLRRERRILDRFDCSLYKEYLRTDPNPHSPVRRVFDFLHSSNKARGLRRILQAIHR